MRITYKDENGIYQLDDNYVSEKGIDINGLDDIIDYIGEREDLEEQLGCPLEKMIEFIKLLKKYYYVEITGKLVARAIWNNTKLNEEELYKINNIFNKIKDKSE